MSSFASGKIATAFTRKTRLHSSHSHGVLWLVMQAHGAVVKGAKNRTKANTNTMTKKMKWHPNFQAESPIICKERSSVAVDSRQPSSNLSNVSSFYPLLAGFKVGITGGDAASWQANQQWFSKAHPRRRNHCSGGGVVSCFFFLRATGLQWFVAQTPNKTSF